MAWTAMFLTVVASARAQPPAPPIAAPPPPAPAADPVETDIRVVQLVESAAARRADGNVDAALDALREANALVKRSRGVNHPDQLPILDQAAEILIEADRLADAEQPLSRAVAIRERLVGSGQTRFEVELASSLLLLGKVHASAGKFDSVVDLISKAVVMLDSSLGPEHEATFKARRELTQAVTIFEETLGPDHPATLRANDELVAVDRSLGDIDGALKAARRNFAARSERLGPGNAEVLGRAVVAADLLECSGRYADAVKLLADAIEAYRAAGAKDSRPLVPALRRLGRMHLDADDFSPAEAAFEAAHALDRDHRGGDHAESVVDRLLLLVARSRRGDEHITEELQPLASRLEEIAATLAPRTPNESGEGGPTGEPATREPAATAAVTVGLRLAGGLWLDLGEPDRAAAAFRRGLELDAARSSADEPDAGSAVAEDHEGLGRCLLANGDAKAARKLFEEAAAESLSSAGPADPRTLRLIVLAARAAAAARDVKVATAMLERLVERNVSWQGGEEPELCRVFDAVATLHEEAGAAERADAIRGKLVDLRRRQFGPRDERVAATLVEIANARQAARRWDAAIPFYEEALAIQQAALGRDHPDVAATLLPAARAYRAVRRNEDAAAALTRALAIWEASVGPSHPVTLATVKSLALVLLSLDQRERAIPLMERLLAAYDADPDTPPADVAKLLTKLAEIRAVRGESATARSLLARAVKLEGGLAASGLTGDNAENVADIARIQRMLGDDEQSAANLARAREIATSVAAPPEQIARIEAAARGAGESSPRPNRQAAAAGPAAPGGPSGPSPAAPARTIAEVILAAWEMFEAGDADEARDTIGRTLRAFERDQGGMHPELADLFVTAADMRIDMAAAEPAASQYERAWKIRAAALGDAHPKTLVAVLRLVAARESAGRVADAEKLAAEALARAGGAFAASASPEDLDAVRDTTRRGVLIAMAGGDRKVARILVETAATVMGAPERRLGFALLDALGDLLATGRSKAASELRVRLLESLAPAVRGNDAAIARLKYHAALAAEQAGDDAAAATAYAEALAIDEKAHGPTSPEAATTAVRLAAARARAGGRPAKLSEDVRQRVRAATEPADRTDDPVEPLRRLAATLLARGETEEAGRAVKSAIDIEAGKSAGRSVTMLHLLSDAADVQVARGNFARAEESLREAVLLGESLGRDARLDAWAVAMKLDRLGTTSVLPTIAETAGPVQMLELAWKEQLSGRPGPARALFDRAIELVESKEGPDAAGTAGVVEQAATAAMRSGDGPRARQLFERLLGIRRRTAGEDSPAAADVAIRLAALLSEIGELTQARELADRSVAIRQQTAGPSAAETVHAMATAARIHLAAGDSQRAIELRSGIPGQLPADAGAGDLAAGLEAARLDLDLGDVESAVARSTAVCETAARGGENAADMLEQGLEIQCDARLAAGQPDIAAGLARRLVAMAEAQGLTGSAAVGVQLARLAAALHAAGDADGWMSAATRSSAILAPVTARMAPTGCRAAVIVAVRRVTSLLVESGLVADAAPLASALEHAADAAMPPAHSERTASLVVAARVADLSGRHDRAMAMLAAAADAAEARSLPRM